MMRFLNPAQFTFWICLGIPPLILYWIRPRPQSVTITTLPFLKWLSETHQESDWLRLLKKILSFLLTLLVILGGAAIVGMFVLDSNSDHPDLVVVLLDRSASMASLDSSGTSRMEQAIGELEDRIEVLPLSTSVSLIAYDQFPEVMVSPTRDRIAIRQALASLKSLPVPDRVAGGLTLARQLAQVESSAVVWHVSDHFSQIRDNQSASKFEIPIEEISVALENTQNVGITAFELQKEPHQPNIWNLFLEVQGNQPEAVEAKLKVFLNEGLFQQKDIQVSSKVPHKLFFTLPADQNSEQVLRVELLSEGDTLAADNVVMTILPTAEPVRIIWITENPNPFTELALQSLNEESRNHGEYSLHRREVEVLQGFPKDWPVKEPHDLVIFDGWIPEVWPKGTPVLLMNPPRSGGPVLLTSLESPGLLQNHIQANDAAHPLLYGVATQRISVTQTSIVYEAERLQPLWAGSSGPLLLAGEYEQARTVVSPISFHVGDSAHFPFMASYPLLLGNAIYWLSAEKREQQSGRVHSTGEIVQLEGAKLEWTEWKEKSVQSSQQTLQQGRVPLKRIGLWRSDQGETGSVALLSSHETRVTDISDSQDQTSDLIKGKAEQSKKDLGLALGFKKWFQGDLRPTIILMMIGILVLESWLFHRHAVY